MAKAVPTARVAPRLRREASNAAGAGNTCSNPDFAKKNPQVCGGQATGNNGNGNGNGNGRGNR